MRSEDRANRVILGLLGLLLIAVGAGALARSYGVFGDRAAEEAVLDEGLRDTAADAGWVLPLGAVTISLVVAYLAWRWLRAQLRTAPALASVELPATEPGDPVTRVRSGAVLDAVSADVESHPAVVHDGGRLIPDADPFTLHLDVTVADGAHVDEVREHVDQVVLPRLRQAVEADRLEAHLHFHSVGRQRVS